MEQCTGAYILLSDLNPRLREEWLYHALTTEQRKEFERGESDFVVGHFIQITNDNLLLRN